MAQPLSDSKMLASLFNVKTYLLGKTWQSIIIGEIMNRNITQEKEKVVEENIK